MKRGRVLGIVFWSALLGLAQGGGADTLSPPLIHLVAQQKPARPNPAVVRVVAPGQGSISFGSGTLVAVNDKHGLVITNWHVINEATAPVSVLFPDGFSSPARVLKIDRDWDLAALAIWKPNVAPVPLATAAPRSGDMLTIAGYGSGTYREATGPCTQYVAPGTRFPYEMVELSAAARQGDSGGPIFNDRGQLAGVLFGEGHGRTAGSYCGRVQWFMTSLAPAGRKPDASTFVAAPGQQIPLRILTNAGAAQPAARTAQPDSGSGQPSERFAATDQRLRPTTPQSTMPPSMMPKSTAPQVTTQEPAQTFATASVTQGSPGEEQARIEPPPASAGVRDLPPADSVSPPPKSQTQYIGWREIAGDTVGQQIKTVFAAVGVLALFLHTLAFMSGQRN